MLRKLQTIKLNFWQQWLLHSFVIWVFFLTKSMYEYWSHVQKHGYMLYGADEQLTLWKKFTQTAPYLGILVLIGVYIIEGTYHYIFEKLKKAYIIFGCILLLTFLYYFGFTIYLRYDGTPLIFNFLVEHLFKGFIPFLLISSIYAFIYSGTRQYITKRIRSAESQSEKSKAELNALKAQVNPHFFFNTLNSLYGTALEEKAARTAECVDQLAGIMRYTMNEAQQDLTPIAREISFLEDYLHLQRLRLPTRKNREILSQIEYDGTPGLIAPMLLIPFIENAFKYGMSVDQECWVHLYLKVENQELHLRIENKLIRESTIAKGQGTGIENAQKRLHLLYPDKHQLHIEQNDTFKVELSLQLQKAAETVAIA